jgi:hypothetical protein
MSGNPPLLALMTTIGIAAVFLALRAASERRHDAMAGWAGLALAASLETAVCTPLIVALLIGRRVPARLWLAAPLSFVAATATARIAGWPTIDLSAIYIGQRDWAPTLSDQAPNLWAIVQALPWISTVPLTGLALAAAIGATAWLVARFAWRPPAAADVSAAALLAALVVPGLLPGMHDRSFVMADVLALMLALVQRDRRSWTICALIGAGSALSIGGALIGLQAGSIVGAVLMVLATALVSSRFLASPANDNGLPLNPFRAYSA